MSIREELLDLLRAGAQKFELTRSELLELLTLKQNPAFIISRAEAAVDAAWERMVY